MVVTVELCINIFDLPMLDCLGLAVYGNEFYRSVGYWLFTYLKRPQMM